MNEIFLSVRFTLTLVMCCLCYFPMNHFRFSKKVTNLNFWVFTAIVAAFNIFLALGTENHSLSSLMLFSIALPYFVLILFLTKGPVAQRIFNFWVWINVYQILSTVISIYKYFIPESYLLDISVVLILFLGYYFLYNRLLKEKHHKIMRELKINWWIISLIPILFMLMFRFVTTQPGPLSQNPQNFIKAIVLNILMVSVYALMFYTFKNAAETALKKQLAQDLQLQLDLQKKHYKEMTAKKQAEAIYRHDARHRDLLLLSLVENQESEKIKELLQKDIVTIHAMNEVFITQSAMINAVLTEYFERAEKKGLKIYHDIKIEDLLNTDETQLCIMLSNLLENAVYAGNCFLEVAIKQVNHQLCIRIKNDYAEKTLCDINGNYLSTKPNESGFGLKSVKAVLEKHGGFLQIEDDGAVFNVFASLKIK